MKRTHTTATVKLAWDNATGNFWVDTGLVVLLRQFGQGEHEIESVLAWLLSRLKGEGKGWLYPANKFINLQARPQNLVRDLRDRKVSCDICSQAGATIDAKMWMYPFVVDPQKFGTFYPGTKRGLRLCARCALAGLAGYLGWLWKAQGRDALHFFIFHSDLREMERLHREVLEPLRVAGEKGGTAPVVFSGPYVNETTLGLLLALFQHARQSNVLPEGARQLLATLLGATNRPPPPVTLYAITGTPGQAFQMKALREFSKLQRLFRMYKGWVKLLAQKLRVDNPHRQLVLIFGQFWAQQGQNRESIWRDRIAWAILEFGDPAPFVEQFLFDVRAREEERNRRPLVRGTIEVLNQYLQEVFPMDEQFQRTLAGFGHSLGAAAQQHNEMGLLYALRNAKNPEDFYRMLNDAQFRLGVTIPEAVLRIEKGERIAGVPWLRVKTLLSIYAMNAYLRRGAPQTEETQPMQES
jgi:hypothetical protein